MGDSKRCRRRRLEIRGDLFDRFRTFDQKSGIAGLVRDWDLSDVTPHQIYYSVLGRLPEVGRTSKGAQYDPAGNYVNALRSAEFQAGVLKSLLEAYPEKRRMIFVHIPKCAGSHLASKIVSTSAALNFRLIDKNWISSDKLFGALQELTSRLTNSKTIVPFGHLPLKWYLSKRLVRFGDFPFSIVRNPAKLVVSQVNYILTRFARDPQLKSLDTQDWARFIDEAKLSASLASGDFRGLALEILFSPQLTPSDIMCKYLGVDTAKSAFETCASAAIELTDLDHYEEWLQTRLGIEAGAASNVSHPYVKAVDLGVDGSERIRLLTEQDNILMERVQTLITKPGRISVSGAELV